MTGQADVKLFVHNNFDNVIGVKVYYTDGTVVKCQVDTWTMVPLTGVQVVEIYEKTTYISGDNTYPTRCMVCGYDKYDPFQTGHVATGETMNDERYHQIQQLAFDDLRF